MNVLCPLSFLTLISLNLLALEDQPTLMTSRGKLLVNEDFAQPLKPFDGKSNGFASGFSGWRWNAVPRGGKWAVEEGVFTGRETAEVKHPATASYGFMYKDVIIQCQVRMNDVPLAGRKYRSLSVRTVDAKDYVCSIHLSEGGFRITKDDNDHAGPDKAVPLGAAKTPLKLDEWHTVVFEVLGNEMLATVDGKSLTGSHELIDRQKHSLMFVVGVEGSVRHLKVWEAFPNADWPLNKTKIQASTLKP
ncbi:LamG domain-containing protein [Prosthecobacter dejongeii]|uniref:3-keto-disaccharide hydrolase domain-containing protein n=1 Tax=Prosthecobacter dejongeii TaxID=48465 RepID=A0A7W7YQY9_9BACT|nr:hypothetical protein [Prosthecobacter dejongeii]MBB5040485.1 hypothetical protein [Prosthecobacter dejongeii]